MVFSRVFVVFFIHVGPTLFLGLKWGRFFVGLWLLLVAVFKVFKEFLGFFKKSILIWPYDFQPWSRARFQDSGCGGSGYLKGREKSKIPGFWMWWIGLPQRQRKDNFWASSSKGTRKAIGKCRQRILPLRWRQAPMTQDMMTKAIPKIHHDPSQWKWGCLSCSTSWCLRELGKTRGGFL